MNATENAKHSVIKAVLLSAVCALIVFGTLAVCGCKSDEQKKEEYNNQLQSIYNDVSENAKALSSAIESKDSSKMREVAANLDDISKRLDALKAPEGSQEIQSKISEALKLYSEACNEFADIFDKISSGDSDAGSLNIAYNDAAQKVNKAQELLKEVKDMMNAKVS